MKSGRVAGDRNSVLRACGFNAEPATTLTLAAAINCIGIGFQRGTHTRWQLVANDGTGAPTLTDMGASIAIATGGVLTLFIADPPNGNSVCVRVVVRAGDPSATVAQKLQPGHKSR